MIIGAGVTGSALLYMCARYTNIKRIALVEKYDSPARVNSMPTHNSQTLHCGDIETNYSLDKALEVQRAARMLRNYALSQEDYHRIIFKYPKMVLGVGWQECRLLVERYETLKPYYPNLKLFDEWDIRHIEPKIFEGRGEEILALGSENEYTAVNFGELARSFIRQARLETDKYEDRFVDVYYNEKVEEVKWVLDKYNIKTQEDTYQTKTFVACAGGHSLQIAHSMGYGLKFSILPIAGSYYFTPKLLNGKVYTVQNDMLPFAAVHGDPDVTHPHATRFGPTALVLPMLERYNYATVVDFFKVLRFDMKLIKSWWNLVKTKDIRNYMLKNILFEIPLIRRRLFLKDVRKIVPTIELRDLKFAHKIGGVRPQLIDKDKGELLMGESKINGGHGNIYNVTPSPGGTSCLENAEIDMRAVAAHLGATIDEELLQRELFDNNNKA